MGLINETGLAEFTTKIKNYLFRKLGIYAINLSVSGGTYSGDSTIKSGETATITITASSGFALPSTISVSGANYTWNNLTGVIVLSNATGDVAISVVCESQAEAFLTFSAADNFTLGVVASVKYWDGTLEYSTDKTTWNTWSGNSGISAASDGASYKLYLRGTGNTKITGNTINPQWVFGGSATSVSVSGNIENLLDYQTVAGGGHPPMASYCFRRWMYQNTKITDCSELILGGTTASQYCYATMFSGCSNLTSSPKIMLTTLAGYCCNYMYSNCQNMITIPKLYSLAVTPTYCYAYMFNNCIKIKLSQTQTGEYINEYRIPITGTGTTAVDSKSGMLYQTGGTFTNDPIINRTYYTPNEVV